MRPRTLDELLGQDHLLRPGSPLRRLVESPSDGGRARLGPTSVVLWGPPGSGKTTIAHLVAASPGRRYRELSAVSAGVKEVRAVIDDARAAAGGLEQANTVLFLDEIHRFTKAQQDALLPSVENRWIVLVAATTENPSFAVVAPLLSRSLVLTLRPLTDDDVAVLVDRARADDRGLAGGVALDPAAREHVVRLAAGDARRALTLLEAAAGTAAAETGADDPAVVTIRLEHAEAAADAAAVRYDRDGDAHYDVASALIKSIRGSDVDAALHYLARMVVAGEDPRFIARRLVVAAAEDIGMADPTALQTAVAAAQAVQLIGMPEGRIVLAQAVVHLATAPKSNAAYLAVARAVDDVRTGRGGPVPAHLRDSSYASAGRYGHGVGYVYAHDAPGGVARQRYLPDDLAGARYYVPTERGAERRMGERLERLQALLGRSGSPAGNHEPETPTEGGTSSAAERQPDPGSGSAVVPGTYRQPATGPGGEVGAPVAGRDSSPAR
jgi:putative ATPase